MPFPCIVKDKVRHIGEAVAAVVAIDRYTAEDAAALVDVDYEPLDAVTDTESATRPDAPLVHEAMGSNLIFDRTFTFGEVDSDFAGADHVVRDQLRWRRSAANPIETPGAIADYNPVSQEFTIWTNEKLFTQKQFELAELLKVPSNKLHLVAVPAGGSFGSKDEMFKVVIIAAMLAKLVGRPVKYLEDRVENLLNGECDGPDRTYDAELAFMNDGTLRSMRVSVTDDYGAYWQRGTGHHGNAFAQVTGPYRISSLSYRLRAVLTNKNQQGAYRGYGSTESNWMLERMVDLAARKLGMDPVEIRRRNFIQPEQFPYKIPTGNVYDSGNYPGALQLAVDLSSYGWWRAEQERLRSEGRHIGIGVASCQIRSVFSPSESWFLNDDFLDNIKNGPVSVPETVTVSVDVRGNVTAMLHSFAMWGNSPETVIAQLVGEEFDVDPASVSVVYANPMGAYPGAGPGGSRLTVMLAGAVTGAVREIEQKLLKVGAHLLEVDRKDVEWADGAVRVRGEPLRAKSLAEIASMIRLNKESFSTPPPGESDPEGFDSGLAATFVYDHPYSRLPKPDRSDLGVFYPIMAHTCHIAIVEVDVETGAVSFLGYFIIQDSGTVMNPRSLEGMVIGGTVQAIGNALTEEIVYSDDGQLLSASFQDYLMPTAMETPPEIVVRFQQTPSPFTAHGIKGGGEGGRMAGAPAISAAIDDALAPWGVRAREVPATPLRIRGWIEAASAGAVESTNDGSVGVRTDGSNATIRVDR
jgi:CO/xanthine dehydrogenase Mo-binding subunit